MKKNVLKKIALKNGLVLALFLCASILHAQPSTATVKSDITKEMGENCTRVDVTGRGSTAREWVNNAWVTYYRIPVNATLKTELAGVTRLFKGAAWYDVNGATYRFKKYNPGTAEYLGMPPLDTAPVRTFLESLGDYGLGGLANIITEVHQLDIRNTPATWHTLNSVSIPVDLTYTKLRSNTQLEKIKEPFEMRLYREEATSKWNNVAWLVPNSATDSRRKASLGITTVSATQMSQIKTLFAQKMSLQATQQFNQLPDVAIPAFSNMSDVASWMNTLLQQGSAEKAEKAFLTLIYPTQRNNAGILSGYASDLLTKLKTATKNDFSSYNDQYCNSINIKVQSAQAIEWWNKDRTKFSRMAVQVENGKWYITDLSINLWQSFNAANARKTADSPCQ
jgi:hypothetical protein